MKLAISNIAWPASEDATVASLMTERGVEGLEIAPTAVWPDPLAVSKAERASYRGRWAARGIEIVALQALLFGKPELQVFGDPGIRRLTLAHLEGMMTIAEELGARALVFGSPKNRLSAGVVPEKRDEIARAFFHEAGERARSHGVVLCIEANPPEYGCDFVTRSDEALALVQRVASAGFGLHLDGGGMTLAREPVVEAMHRAAGRVQHFHASEPFLAPVGEGGADHPAFAAALRSQGYQRWVSVEMRQPADGSAVAQVERALDYLVEVYGGAKPER